MHSPPCPQDTPNPEGDPVQIACALITAAATIAAAYLMRRPKGEK
ncbi:hypothetical protein ACODT5_28780 [Streptomyces sp. 5.8]